MLNKLLKQIEKDITKEEKCLENENLPEMLKLGHKMVLKVLRKYKKKIEKEMRQWQE